MTKAGLRIGLGGVWEGRSETSTEAEQRGEGSLWKRMQVMVSEPVVQKRMPQEGGGRDW